MSIIKTLRVPKVAGVAVFDVAGTFAISCLICKFTSIDNKILGSFAIFIILIIIAVVIHWALNIPTMLNHYIGINSLKDVIDGRKLRGEIE